MSSQHIKSASSGPNITCSPKSPDVIECLDNPFISPSSVFEDDDEEFGEFESATPATTNGKAKEELSPDKKKAKRESLPECFKSNVFLVDDEDSKMVALFDPEDYNHSKKKKKKKKRPEQTFLPRSSLAQPLEVQFDLATRSVRVKGNHALRKLKLMKQDAICLRNDEEEQKEEEPEMERVYYRRAYHKIGHICHESDEEYYHEIHDIATDETQKIVAAEIEDWTKTLEL
ncbi:hypothetical protein CC78DRAFT_544276 [Lojkania enalia]|uniref:Uncharacterized protein n=1 Tax=Lojkania enalia TaxID=147567 RepID=A0A9P4MZZ2_9PLEO|nr:hypothetical protein CC78DRAFT_544276 [Didymosphaeria enalia]